MKWGYPHDYGKPQLSAPGFARTERSCSSSLFFETCHLVVSNRAEDVFTFLVVALAHSEVVVNLVHLEDLFLAIEELELNLSGF